MINMISSISLIRRKFFLNGEKNKLPNYIKQYEKDVF